MGVFEVLVAGLRDAALMAWQVWWGLVFGFAVSAFVQTWVPRERIQAALSGSGVRPVSVATGLGAASSSCSYAAIAIGRSLFSRGASAATSLAFQFASTNLVWELGLVLWVLLGWQFTLAQYLGGLVMIALMALLLRGFVSPRLEAHAREHADAAGGGHDHGESDAGLPWREKVTSAAAWGDVGAAFLADWRMLWKEILIGFVVAGFVGQLPSGIFDVVFLQDASGAVRTVGNVVVGPLLAVASFVCSLGNVPVAAVLWSGGLSFGGVLAFLFADLIVLPIILVYRKYYGTAYTLRIVALMLATMMLAALVVDLAFGAVGLVPDVRPDRTDVFGSVRVDYKLVLNVLGAAGFATLAVLARRRRA